MIRHLHAVLVLLFVLFALASPAQGAPPPTLDFDAGLDDDGNSTWESETANQSRNWSLGANVTRQALSSTATNLTHAYLYPGGSPRGTAADGGSATDWQNFNENVDASFEFWLRPSDTSANQVVWETGGTTDGSSLTITGGEYRFTMKDGGANVVATAEIPDTDEFHQLVAVYTNDDPGTTDSLRLFLDAEESGSDTATGVNDWTGGDDAGIGRANSQTGGSGADGVSICRAASRRSTVRSASCDSTKVRR